VADTPRRIRAANRRKSPGELASEPTGSEGGGGRVRRWSDKFTFVLALAGACIGFKAIWQFPYLASENGGGAFILVYLLFAFLIGAPLLIAEVMLGRRTHASPITTFTELSRDVYGRRYWPAVGWLMLVGGFLVLASLNVIAAWTAGYLLRSLSGVFNGLTADGIASVFTLFVKDPEKQLFWHLSFIAVTTVVVARGVRRGIGPAVQVFGALLFVSLLALVLYAVITGNLEDAALYVLTPDFAKLSPAAWIAALAHVFFGFGLGTGIAMMYGAYLPRDVSLVRATMTAVGLDALIVVCASVVVMAVLLGGGVAPTAGPSLVFQAMPLAFDHLPLGSWFASVFFILLLCLAFLTSIALAEPCVAWVSERFRLTRRRAALVVGLGAWLLGVVAILSFNHWAFSFKFFGAEKTLGIFDGLQILTAQLLLPVGGIFAALFAGWALSAEQARTDLALRSPCAFDTWWWLLRVVVPLSLLVLLFNLYTLYA
jgi:neurotransmitter:Na+ symporter, NSS family